MHIKKGLKTLMHESGETKGKTLLGHSHRPSCIFFSTSIAFSTFLELLHLVWRQYPERESDGEPRAVQIQRKQSRSERLKQISPAGPALPRSATLLHLSSKKRWTVFLPLPLKVLFTFPHYLRQSVLSQTLSHYLLFPFPVVFVYTLSLSLLFDLNVAYERQLHVAVSLPSAHI